MMNTQRIGKKEEKINPNTGPPGESKLWDQENHASKQIQPYEL